MHTPPHQIPTMQQWLDIGIAAGYCTHTYCDIHEPPRLTDDEAAALEAGIDNCVWAVRIYTDTLPFYPAPTDHE